jgi:hypothetical protein
MVLIGKEVLDKWHRGLPKFKTRRNIWDVLTGGMFIGFTRMGRHQRALFLYICLPHTSIEMVYLITQFFVMFFRVDFKYRVIEWAAHFFIWQGRVDVELYCASKCTIPMVPNTIFFLRCLKALV